MTRMTPAPDFAAKHLALLRAWVTLVRDPARRFDEQAHAEQSRAWAAHHRGKP